MRQVKGGLDIEYDDAHPANVSEFHRRGVSFPVDVVHRLLSQQ